MSLMMMEVIGAESGQVAGDLKVVNENENLEVGKVEYIYICAYIHSLVR